MDILWINKYKPTHINEITINLNKINEIKLWLKSFYNKNNTISSILISGNHGIGKNITIELLLKSLNYKIKLLSSSNFKKKIVIKNIIDSYRHPSEKYIESNHVEHMALVIEIIECVTLTSEKECILELCKLNSKNKILPIIFISTNQHSKLISDIKKNSHIYYFNDPSYNDLQKIVYTIINNENIQIKDINIINLIIKYSQNDIRKLIYLLQDLYLTYAHNLITLQKFNIFLNYSHKKNIEIGLYNATNELLNNYKSINKCMELYEFEKVLLPLMIYENYHLYVFNNNFNNIKQLDISRKICDSISKGDVIETNIYSDQNWSNQSIHGLYTICDTSYNINILNNNNNNNNNTNKLEFSADLNKTSLKNINKKNIINIQNILSNNSIDDIIYINKIIYTLIDKNKIKEAYEICKDYSINIKYLEILIKIDKTNKKLSITPKIKKLFC
jgi:DNA polymerase III delta prime subunit